MSSITAMRTTHRPRRYVSPAALLAIRPLFRYSVARDAYVLRLVGNRRGPVMRVNRRRSDNGFGGEDRRQALV